MRQRIETLEKDLEDRARTSASLCVLTSAGLEARLAHLRISLVQSAFSW